MTLEEHVGAAVEDLRSEPNGGRDSNASVMVRSIRKSLIADGHPSPGFGAITPVLLALRERLRNRTTR